ncbi:MAG: formyl transferase [Rickettsiaceae bacterium]|jgi:methionyl-tRNA formyltransferase|nr:formyl transferase [Rickettsiaceae bacterium]
MKILLCINRDIYCLLTLNYLLHELSSHEVKIHFSDFVGKKPEDENLRILQNYEQDFSIGNIRALLEKAEIGDVDLEEFLSFEQIKNNYQILDFKNINQDGFDFLSVSWKPDLIISIRFGKIFKDQIINLPKFGIINLHSGILPNYRGIMATFWAMLNKEKEIGTTLHFVGDSSIDTGDIINICKKPTDYKKSYISNVLGLYRGGIEAILSTVRNLENNLPIEVIKQDKESGKYFSYPEGKKFSNLF